MRLHLSKSMPNPASFSCRTFGVLALALGAASAAHAEQGDVAGELPGLTVIGSADAVERLPGSGAFLDTAVLGDLGYDDINQLARRTPGLYFRSEDGFGLFPNVSLRGVSMTRNAKITVMEDGVLAAPAPYSAPAAYYTPATGRMAGLEVLKGSAQVRYGPQTTGGVLNYLSTRIPAERATLLDVRIGADGDRRGRLSTGDQAAVFGGTLGWLVELDWREVSGFKRIDGTAGTYAGSRDTGFERFEPMFKARWVSGADSRRQTIEVKVGATDLEANETYLGLSEADFRADPYRRYAASRFDLITTENLRGYVRHGIELTGELDLTTTVYGHDFKRSWYKLDAVRPAGGGSYLNMSEVLALGHGQGALDVLRGNAAGDLRVRNNNRSYDVYGIEALLRWKPAEMGDVRHTVESGIRFHRDSETRFQNDDIYTQDSSGSITGVTPGVPGTQDNRTGRAEAVSFWIENRIDWGSVSVVPGVRYENVRFTNTRRSTALGPNFNTVLPGFPQAATLDVWAPGVGATWQATADAVVFGGVYRGFSLPGPGDATGANPLSKETSLGWEVGVRWNNRERALRAELALFWTDFDDLIVPNNIGGGGLATVTENAGAVRTRGVEFAIAGDAMGARNDGWRAPWSLAFTLTDAVLRSDVNADGSGGAAVESIFAGGRRGQKLPYIPDWQIAAGAGFGNDQWLVRADAIYVPATWGTANNTDNFRRGADADGPLDARFGRTDAYFLLDLSVGYQLSERVRLMAAVENALDRQYVASRVPHGPRPGRGRAWTVGAQISW